MLLHLQPDPPFFLSRRKKLTQAYFFSSICELWELAVTCVKAIIMVRFSQANICDARTCMLLSRAIDKIEFALRVMMYLRFPVSIERTCAVTRALSLSACHYLLIRPLDASVNASLVQIWFGWHEGSYKRHFTQIQPSLERLPWAGKITGPLSWATPYMIMYESYSSSNNVSCFKNVLKIRFRSTFLCCYFRCDVIAVDVTLVWRVRATDAWCSCLSSVFGRSATNEWSISCVWV